MSNNKDTAAIPPAAEEEKGEDKTIQIDEDTVSAEVTKKTEEPTEAPATTAASDNTST